MSFDKVEFNRKLYDENDKRAKEACISYLTSRGWDARENPDIYGIDVIAEKEGRIIHVECEVRKEWSNSPFPFVNLHVPGRKERLFNNSIQFYYMTFSNDLSQCLAFNSSSLRSDRMINMPNSRCPDGELFFIVSLSECKHIILGDNNASTVSSL